MQVSVIIPAAGRSRRFGESDKLAQDIGGRPLLLRTVELFAKRDEVTSIIVAGPPGDEEFAAFRDKFAATLGFHGARVVEGGRIERWETVKKALEAVPDDSTHIAVHDAARPGASKELLDRIFEAAAIVSAVVPALPVSATVKRLTAEEREIIAQAEDEALADVILGDAGRSMVRLREVVETVDRTSLFEIQTPQVFTSSVLRRAYESGDFERVTDDASLVERLGEKVHAVEGESRNFKVTTPADLVLMRSVLGEKPPAERPVHKRF